jgi:putative sugar O-methyltransferase
MSSIDARTYAGSGFLDQAICDTAQQGPLDAVGRLHQSSARLRALDHERLCRACEDGSLEVVRNLHQNGAELNAQDNEPLRRAAAAGHVAIVRYIHQNGGNISARNHEALRRAAASRSSAVVKYLHEAGAATKWLTTEARQSIDQMKQELRAAPAVFHPSAFWEKLAETNEQMLDWVGETNFKRTLNQNYFNAIPTAHDDARMVRMRRLTASVRRSTLKQYAIGDPDCDPASWVSCYPNYFIFKDPDRAVKLELYREHLARMTEYALRRDRSGLLDVLEEPMLGNPIRVTRRGKLISQDLVNSVRERNSLLDVMKAESGSRYTVAELGAGYGRLGYVLLRTTQCRYVVFDIPPALHLSQWYLTTLFPERRAFRFRRFDAFAEIESELSQADIAFFTANQLEKFPPGYFDAFATISSIHEMRRDQIRHFMTEMGRTTKSALYLKQQRNYVNPADNLTIGRNDYPTPTGWVPGPDCYDLINPRFFERLYRRR